MSKELQKTKETEVMKLTAEMACGMDEATADDIIIPRILLMQGTSKWVPDTFAQGDIINSLEAELMAKKGKTLLVLPFCMMKTWESFKAEEPNKGAWLGAEQWTPANDDVDWEYVCDTEWTTKKYDGPVQAQRQKQYAFYVLAIGENSTCFTPLIVAFRSASGFKDGKKIASHFATMKGLKQPGHNVVWALGAETVKDEKNNRSFQKWTVKKERNATKEEMDSAIPWMSMIAAGSVKTQEEEETVEAKAETTVTATKKPATKAADVKYTDDAIPF